MKSKTDQTIRRLHPDEAARLPVAAQVLDGKFDRADDSTIRSIRFGLEVVPHPDARRALERLA